MQHSGQCKAIATLEKNDEVIFKRLHALEKAVWKAAGATGVVMGIVMVIIQKVLLK
jgi:hypothetical protein